jgi:SAM-dependent methyltransferase
MTDSTTSSSSKETARIEGLYCRQYRSNGYQARWRGSNRGNVVMAEEVRAAELDLLRKHARLPNSTTRALDFGCGSGFLLDWLCKLGGIEPNFYGIDIRSEAVASAANRYPNLNFCQGGEGELPFREGFFELIQMHLVLSSILRPHLRRQVCEELDRVLARNGAIVIYDLRVNNPGNPNVRHVRRNEIRGLFPKYSFHFQSLTVLPPLARKLGPVCSLAYPLFNAFRFLRTHNMGIGVKH